MSAAPRRFGRGLFASVDPASLAFVRIAFGLVMAWEVWRFSHYGWIESYYIKPSFHFTYLGFDWVRPWPGSGMYVHFAVLAAAAIGIALGFAYRVCAVVFCAAFTYVFLLEKARYLNHFYLICLLSLLLVFIPAHRGFSLDARISGERRAAPAWSISLLRAQVGLVYLYAGIAKINWDWLRGEPMRAWLADRADLPVIGFALDNEVSTYFFSYGGLALDLAVWPMLAWKRTRAAMFLFTSAFHLLNAALFDIGVFPWLMLGATTIFFEPDWPRRLLRRPAPAFEPLTTTPAQRRIVVTLISAYLAIQFLVPFRHLLYPGTVHWTEEGHDFSWHMKLRDKEAKATFHLTDPATGEKRIVDPRTELTSMQARKMASRPDMVQQFARHLALTRAQPGGRLEVRAHVTASLNGRESQHLVDPTIDLAAEPRDLRPARWIVPLTTPLHRAE